MNNRGFVMLPVLFIILITGALVYLAYNNKNLNSNSQSLLTQTPTYSPTPTFEPELDLPITTPSSKSGWVTYTNDTFGYKVDLPAGSLLINEDEYNRTRIQNYPSRFYGHRGLKEGEYYLEIVDYKKSGKTPADCINDLENPVAISDNNANGYKGYINPDTIGGDSARYIYLLCIEKDDKNLHIAASEDIRFYSKEIIDSFRFID